MDRQLFDTRRIRKSKEFLKIRYHFRKMLFLRLFSICYIIMNDNELYIITKIAENTTFSKMPENSISDFNFRISVSVISSCNDCNYSIHFKKNLQNHEIFLEYFRSFFYIAISLCGTVNYSFYNVATVTG